MKLHCRHRRHVVPCQVASTGSRCGLADVFSLLTPQRWLYLKHIIQCWMSAHYQCQLHLLRMSDVTVWQKLKLKLCWPLFPDNCNVYMLIFRCLHGTAPPYLVNELCRVADIDARRQVHSASTSALVTPSSRRSTIGDRAFFVAALRIWKFATQCHCVRDTRHLQAPAEDTSLCCFTQLTELRCTSFYLYC